VAAIVEGITPHLHPDILEAIRILQGTQLLSPHTMVLHRPSLPIVDTGEDGIAKRSFHLKSKYSVAANIISTY